MFENWNINTEGIYYVHQNLRVNVQYSLNYEWWIAYQFKWLESQTIIEYKVLTTIKKTRATFNNLNSSPEY